MLKNTTPHGRSRGLIDAFLDVEQFRIAGEAPVLMAPTFPDPKRIDLCKKLHVEEITELHNAIDARDMVGVADGITDLIYVLISSAFEFGIPLPDVWFEVHASNMAKIDPKTGKVLKREDGKILKPEGWQPPDIAAVLEAARKRFEARIAAVESAANG